jgi:hypothetical protein
MTPSPEDTSAQAAAKIPVIANRPLMSSGAAPSKAKRDLMVGTSPEGGGTSLGLMEGGLLKV